MQKNNDRPVLFFLVSAGIWRNEKKNEFKGDTTIQIETGLERLPNFKKIK